MKKILITGANSYIGTKFADWIKASDNKKDYTVEELDMITPSWREHDFSKYDVIFHVAGIAHIKETEENKDLYYKVNKDLAIETAKKAKDSGVKHFILMSSMSVFGLTTGEITFSTVPKPVTHYGKAKLEADLEIEKLNCAQFNVSILRPPMVYGPNCKGNFQRLAKLAAKSPVFPNYRNKRSMIYIDFLCEFVKGLIDISYSSEKLNERIYYYPQNEKYVATVDMVRIISNSNSKKIWLVKGFNPLVKLLSKKINLFGKVFGDLTYDMEMSIVEGIEYFTTDFESTIS